MKIKSFSMAMLAAMLATSCAMEEVVETNGTLAGDPIDFTPTVNSPTRAVSATLSNLGDFNVFAKGIRSDLGTLYKPFLIGTDRYTPSVASRMSLSEESGTWQLENNVYWPSDINTALFWAFTDRKASDPKTANGLCISSGTVDFYETYGPQILNYSPLKADLSKPIGDYTGWFDGDYQRDLVSAFTQQTKNPHVSLSFHHLLSQIEINAVSKHSKQDEESRIVKIKGAWLVNVISSGSLSAQFSYDQSTQTAQDNPVWTTGGNVSSYGTVYSGNDRTVPIVVNGKPGPLNILGNEGHGNLMLIPQSKKSWDGTSASTTGAYLLLLCRIDMGHKGEVTPGSAVSPTINGVHYHQQFPVSSYYDEDAYGLTAIPVPVDWEMNKKYTYNLDICGENSGAGKYPPNVPTDPTELEKYLKSFIPGDYVINATSKPEPSKANIITTIPAGKNVGEYVLDEPIQFKVTVSTWDEGTEWSNGNDLNKTVAEE
ncbi:MAG: fimbrillin family protein [Muribaculaceae bacterium]|nr:fimbrillin family protein [Muribaculaceae bacterium]